MTTTTKVTTQAVLGALRAADFQIGRKTSAHLGWVAEAVDNNNKYALTVDGRVYTPAEAVRLTYNHRGYKFALDKRDAQMADVVAALTAKGWFVTNTEANGQLLVKVAA